jgi:hypothetical protein
VGFQELAWSSQRQHMRIHPVMQLASPMV